MHLNHGKTVDITRISCKKDIGRCKYLECLAKFKLLKNLFISHMIVF